MLSIDRTAVSREELLARRDKLLSGLAEAGVSQAVLTTPEDVYYLTGIDIGGRTLPRCVVINADGSHRYVSRRIERHWHDHYAPLTWCTDWLFYGDDSSLEAGTVEASKELGGVSSQVLGFELDRPSIAHDVVRRIAAETGAGSVAAVHQLIERQRLVKSPREVANMKQAGEITRLGIEAGAEAIRSGASESEAAGAAFTAMARQWGSEALASGPFVASGPRTAMAHTNWQQVVPKQGDVVVIWMSGSYYRYQAPVERTYVKGDVDSRTARMLEVSAQAVKHVLAHLKPGMTSAEGDQLCRDVIEEAGFGEYFLNRAAYGIGISYPPVWWEQSLAELKPGSDLVLQAGMTFHLVPALHVPGLGFINRSLPIAITETGCEALSTMPLEVPAL